MERSKFDKYLDYFPILAYFGFWIQGAFIGALLTGEPKLFALGLVTTPAVVAMMVATLKIAKNNSDL